MSEEQFIQHIQSIHSQIAALRRHMISLAQQPQEQVAVALEAIASSLDNLQLIHEQMQTSLETREVVEEQLLEHNEYLAVKHQLYYELFQFAPDAYLLTDSKGIILEANWAAATLLNIWQTNLIGKPLAIFVAEAERQAFRTWLNKLLWVDQVQDWETCMCPRDGEPFAAHLKVAPVYDLSGHLVSLRLFMCDVSKYKQSVAKPLQLLTRGQIPVETEATSLPRSLDGLNVLVVDDEADARELITAVLEQQGISVTAVASAAEALAVLERSQPDVLISDIRMPEEDGYALIRKVRALESQKGWQIPAAALTAYVSEEQVKLLSAGFQSYIHKLAEPRELIATVVQLAGRTST